MTRNRIGHKRNKRSFNLVSLCILPLLIGGCSSHDRRFSYFNMLDIEPTAHNKQVTDQFWSSVRPVSTLSAAHYKLGRYYQQQQKYDKAIAEFSKALRDDSNYCKAYNGIAMSYDGLQRCEMASTSYEQAIRCDPQEAYLYNNYACSSILCGDYQKGLDLLSEAGQLSRDDKRIKNNMKLAQMLVERQNKQAEPVLPETTVALLAKSAGQAVELENKGPQADPPDEKTLNPMSQTTPTADVPDKLTGESEQNSRESEVQADALTGQTTSSEEKKESQSLQPVVESIVSTETAGEVASSLPDDIVINNLVIETVKDTSGEDRPKTTLDYLKSTAIEVSNGNGMTGMAGKSADYLRSYGFNIGRVTNARYFNFDASIILYREGFLQVAEELARLTPGFHNIEKVDSLERPTIGVRIILGRDLAAIHFPDGYAGNVNPDIEKTGSLCSTNNIANLAVTD